MTAAALVAIALPVGLAAAIPSATIGALALRLAPWAAVPALACALRPGETLEAPGWLLGLRVGLDETGRAFLLLTAALWLVAGAAARRYHRDDPRRCGLWACWLLALAGNVWLVLARDAAGFYTAFALMTFAGYGLVVHARTPEAIDAGRAYLTLAVVGEAALLAGLVLRVSEAADLALPLARSRSGSAVAATVLLFLGFGVKAGLAGLHGWLPLAHPVAPTPASAVLSGAMIKAGVLGWLRFLPLGGEPWPLLGSSALGLGLLGAFGGVVAGLAQRAPKTMLAYSSVSQVGFIVVGVGAALLSPAVSPALTTAITLYAVHHGLAKGALFLGVGAVPSLGARRRWGIAVLAIPALALAGAPGTSGALAKSALKGATQALPDAWSLWLGVLLPAAAVGTTLLMIRFLLAVVRESPAAKAGVQASWLAAVLASALLPWLVAPSAVGGDPIGAAGPVVVGVAIAAGAVYRRALPAAVRLRIPPGDVLAWATPSLRGAWQALLAVAATADRRAPRDLRSPGGAGLARLEERLRRYGAAGLVGLVLVALLAIGCAAPLRVGSSGDYPPFSVRAPDGTWDGFDVAVARAYARDRGRRLVLVPFRWPELETALGRGDFEVAMSGVTVRADRLCRGRFTAAVARVRAVWITPPGSRAVRTVAVNRGGHLERLARERLPGVTLLPIDDNRALLEALRTGVADGVVTDTAEAAAALAAGEYVVRQVLAHDRKAYWLAPTSGALQAELDAWLLARERDGTLAALRRRYLGADAGPTVEPAASWAVDLLGRRLLLMPGIAAAKRKVGLPLVDPEREGVVISRVPVAVRPLMAAAIAAGRAVQRAAAATAVVPDAGLVDYRAAVDRIDAALVRAVTAAMPVDDASDALLGQLRDDAALPGADDGIFRPLVEALRAVRGVGGGGDELPRDAGWAKRASSEDRRMALLDLFGGRGESVKVGDEAPDFALPDANGRMVRLSELRGKKPVVLFFYPKDDTPGCTKEACSFRDAYEEFVQRGAEVIGISSDDEASHRRFAERYRLPFTLLADHGGKVRRAYGVPATLGVLPGRVTYVIDAQGIVRHVFNSQLQATQHVTEALEALRRIAEERG